MAKREKTYKRGRFGHDDSVRVTICEEQSCAYGKVFDLFHAVWASPDGIFQIELDMQSSVDLIKSGDQIVGEERSPTILVYVTLRRSLAPQLLLQPRAERGSAGR